MKIVERYICETCGTEYTDKDVLNVRIGISDPSGSEGQHTSLTDRIRMGIQ